MKKALFLIVSVALCTSLMAQSYNRSTAAKQAVPFNYVTAGAGVEESNAAATTPTVRASFVQKGVNYDLHPIGATHYALPTNSTPRNLISFHPTEPAAASTWTTASTVSDTRGTGINYYDTDSRDWYQPVLPSPRIETERTGWGTHGFTAKGEIVISHNSEAGLDAGLVVATRDEWGKGSWEFSMLQTEPYVTSENINGSSPYDSRGLVWPTMVTVGDTVHVIAVTEQQTRSTSPTCPVYITGYKVNGNHYQTVPLYFRSVDGGKNWDITEKHFLTDGGMTEYELSEIRGDSYVIAARGSHIVFLYEDITFINYMESRDGGETWKKVTVYECEDFVTPPAPTVDVPRRLVPSTAGIYIDEKGVVHVVMGTRVAFMDAGDCSVYYNPYVPTSMLYWNSTHDPIDWQDLVAPNVLDDVYSDKHKWYSYPYYIDMPSVLGFDRHNAFSAGEYEWDIDMPWYIGGNTGGQFRSNGWVIYPRVVAQDGKVYVSYQAPLEWPLSPTGQEAFFRGIFVTVSEDGGASWDVQENTSWVSYQPELFEVDWDNYTGPIDPTSTVDELKDWAKSINHVIMSECAYPTMSTNIKADRVLLQWYAVDDPLYDDPIFQKDPLFVYAFQQALWELPQYNRLSNVRQGICNKIAATKPTINAKIYPNPAVGGVVNVNVETNSPYTITVTNIMGQEVYKDINVKTINVSNFIPGVYIVNVRTKEATTSQKMIVR